MQPHAPQYDFKMFYSGGFMTEPPMNQHPDQVRPQMNICA